MTLSRILGILLAIGVTVIMPTTDYDRKLPAPFQEIVGVLVIIFLWWHVLFNKRVFRWDPEELDEDEVVNSQ